MVANTDCGLQFNYFKLNIHYLLYQLVWTHKSLRKMEQELHCQ